MSDDRDISQRLQEAWHAVLAAEQARGGAMADGGDAVAAQHAYETVLEHFRHTQIEAFTVTLGYIPMIWERLDGLEARLATLERLRTLLAATPGPASLADTPAARLRDSLGPAARAEFDALMPLLPASEQALVRLIELCMQHQIGTLDLVSLELRTRVDAHEARVAALERAVGDRHHPNHE